MLIIVEDRNIAFFFQLSLDLKAARCRNIFQVHTCKAAGDQINGIDDLIHIMALDAQRKCVHITKCLKQYTFSFHNRHTCLRSDVSKTKDSTSIGHYQAKIVTAGQFIALLHILLDLQTRLCHTRRISQRQVILCSNRNCCNNLDLTFPFLMKSQ